MKLDTHPTSPAHLWFPNQWAQRACEAFVRREIPAILLHGPVGTGKSDAAKVLIKGAMTYRPGLPPGPFCKFDLKHDNAAQDSGVAVLESAVVFASTYPQGECRGWWVDEVDELSQRASSGLKGTFDRLENLGVQMVFTTNSPSAVSAAILSRCEVIEWRRPSPAQLVARAQQVLAQHGKTLDATTLYQLAVERGGDTRQFFRAVELMV
ncbi:AAA family ATPase [Teichococcus vastitatis]|uniref:AAA family ATPase n=1 Tax=Teichococcus vastitatis TaxID=2307076 RepID=UPI000E7263CE|nr:AAA family ATPase [Pseudoroseomonas vastitatis]